MQYVAYCGEIRLFFDGWRNQKRKEGGFLAIEHLGHGVWGQWEKKVWRYISGCPFCTTSRTLFEIRMPFPDSP